MRGAALDEARGGSPGLRALFRADALALVVIFGPGHVGWAGLTALMVLGVVPDAVGGLLVLVWTMVSFLTYLWGYRWIEGRRRQKRLAILASTGMPRLAERVVALYSRPDSPSCEGSGAAEVFALYRRAQQSLEVEKDPRRAGEEIERGISLADEILYPEGGGDAPRTQGNRQDEREER